MADVDSFDVRTSLSQIVNRLGIQNKPGRCVHLDNGHVAFIARHVGRAHVQSEAFGLTVGRSRLGRHIERSAVHLLDYIVLPGHLGYGDAVAVCLDRDSSEGFQLPLEATFAQFRLMHDQRIFGRQIELTFQQGRAGLAVV